MNWTGNVRQLRNVVERLHILSDDRITADVSQTVCQPLNLLDYHEKIHTLYSLICGMLFLCPAAKRFFDVKVDL